MRPPSSCVASSRGPSTLGRRPPKAVSAIEAYGAQDQSLGLLPSLPTPQPNINAYLSPRPNYITRHTRTISLTSRPAVRPSPQQPNPVPGRPLRPQLRLLPAGRRGPRRRMAISLHCTVRRPHDACPGLSCLAPSSTLCATVQQRSRFCRLYLPLALCGYTAQDLPISQAQGTPMPRWRALRVPTLCCGKEEKKAPTLHPDRKRGKRAMPTLASAVCVRYRSRALGPDRTGPSLPVLVLVPVPVPARHEHRPAVDLLLHKACVTCCC